MFEFIAPVKYLTNYISFIGLFFKNFQPFDKQKKPN